MTRTISINKGDVYNSIDLRLAKLSDISLSGLQADRVASDTEDEYDAKILKRYVEARDARIRQLLAFALVTDSTIDMEFDATLNGKDPSYIYILNLGDESSLNLKGLAILMHEYLVTGAIADWLSRSGLQLSTSYDRDALELESSIVKQVRGSGLHINQSRIYKSFGRRR